MHLEGDTGAWIRSALGSIVIHGSPPEEYYPYDVDRYEEEPDILTSLFAQSFQALKYFRLDKGIPSDQTLVDRMKDYVSRGYCLGFGFTVFESFDNPVHETGVIPYPQIYEEVIGGHTVFIVGYNKINGEDHFLFKNSWSEEWGEGGYGYIPAKYFIRQPQADAPMADDVWAITKYEWLNTDEFGFHDV
jgi:C1A family cysteine protease